MKSVAFILFVFFYSWSYTQVGVEVDFSLGQVIKHRAELLFEKPSMAFGTSLRFQKQTVGEKPWQRYWGNPIIEGSINYLNFGDNDVLGSAWSFTPGIIFPLKKWKHLSLHLHYSTGIAFLTKQYHRQDNPSNNAIGSTINNTTIVKVSLCKKIDPNWKIRLGLNVVHYSNGLTSSPNKGLNVYSLSLGVSKSGKKKERVVIHKDSLSYRKIGLNMQTGIGLTEYSIPGGPNFPVYAISIGSYYRYSDFQRLHVGLEFEYSVSVAEFERATLRPELAHSKARRTIIYLGNELMFGEVRFRLQAGYYTKIYSAYEGKPIYFKLQTSYHPSFLKNNVVSPYVGVMLKTHNAIAEYISINLGVDF